MRQLSNLEFSNPSSSCAAERDSPEVGHVSQEDTWAHKRSFEPPLGIHIDDTRQNDPGRFPGFCSWPPHLGSGTVKTAVVLSDKFRNHPVEAIASYCGMDDTQRIDMLPADERMACFLSCYEIPMDGQIYSP